ncbi:hypothetical protein [Brevibacillus daliensis]|uniref:hypothetical protein n=1 Tax=Brevibacillus daliensis TaxID=2892995 RepID=UPI001E4D120E|nr:hypothetical protein [Brevibacillus daliensis]
MSFADLVGYLITGLADLLTSFFKFLAKPISWFLQLLDGVFYFIYKLFTVIADLLHLFLALLQAVLAVVAGLFRTIQTLLAWNGGTFTNKLGNDGIDIFIEALRPLGVLQILPYLLLALDVFLTGYLIIRIVGGQNK